MQRTPGDTIVYNRVRYIINASRELVEECSRGVTHRHVIDAKGITLRARAMEQYQLWRKKCLRDVAAHEA